MKTVQALLEERRAFVNEQRNETDVTARAMLQYEIDEIDRELARRCAGVIQPPVKISTARAS